MYAHFPVDPEVAKVATLVDDGGSVGIISGSASTANAASLAYRNLFGRYDTRYTTPKTPSIISQPFGKAEFDLFHFETLSDGAWGNNKFKASIRNVRKSDNQADPYGTFTVEIRNFYDSDLDQEVVESYPECSLNPRSERYVAAVIGDMKASYHFDAEDEEERRLIVDGKYPNKSTLVRVVMSNVLESGQVPSTALPFGFRGVPIIKTNNQLTDGASPTRICLLYTSPSPRDQRGSGMPASA